MFWADKIVNHIEKDLTGDISQGRSLVIRDEKTASGKVHVGSMRGVVIHGIIAYVLNEKKIANSFLYEINDFDPMDDLPAYLDADTYRQYMGKPLYTIPSPDGKEKNYAEYFAKEFIEVIERSGFHPTYHRTSELYLKGIMNDCIRLALERAPEIRAIYKNVSGSVKSDDWLPLHVVCEECGRIGTTKVISFDGEKVKYACKKDLVAWAEGCGHEGEISPFDGNSKLPWKVEWAAKFNVLGVNIEGAGKDHSTKGGARDIADHIAKEIFNYDPPFDIPYEFFLVEGKKMSSSKGEGNTAKEISDLLPTHIFRLALLWKDPKKAVDFIPDGDTIPVLFDTYDKIAEKHWSGIEDDEARLFELAHAEAAPEKHFLPRFSEIAFIVQMPHLTAEKEVADMKGGALTEADQNELKEREEYAKKWLSTYAPEQYKYELQTKSLPEKVKAFSDAQKKTLAEVLEYVKSQEKLNGQELHTTLHEIRKESGLEPQEFFSALYMSFLGKESGPKAGWFLSVLDKDFLESRLQEAAQSPGVT